MLQIDKLSSWIYLPLYQIYLLTPQIFPPKSYVLRGGSPKNCKITLKVIGDQITITCSKSDLKSDQDHNLEYRNKVIGNQIVISDH